MLLPLDLDSAKALGGFTLPLELAERRAPLDPYLAWFWRTHELGELVKLKDVMVDILVEVPADASDGRHALAQAGIRLHSQPHGLLLAPLRFHAGAVSLES